MDLFPFLALIGGLLFAAAIYVTCEALGIQGCSYKLGPRGLWIWHFGFLPGRFIPYGTILEARRATLYETFLGQTHGFLLRRGVRLELSKGFWGIVIVTPRHPEAFLAELRARVPPQLRL